MKSSPDAVVIGAGPCGIAAAVQLSRSGFHTLLFEARRVGGLLHNANLVENYPGFPRGIAGGELCRLLREHVDAAGIDLVVDAVTDAVPVGVGVGVSGGGGGGGYNLRTRSGLVVKTRVLIVATGTRPRTGLISEPADLVGSRVFYEPVDLPADVAGEEVLVVGGGDAAFDYALNVAGRGASVTILRRGAVRCLPLLRERVSAREAITERAGATVLSLEAAPGGVSARIADDRGVEEIVAHRILVACGRIPSNDLLHSLARSGRIANHLSLDLFSGGDVVRGPFRQAGIAVGDGLLAAMAAARYLRGECP
jgi:thioredoxin reductase (NADPH)